MREEIGRANKIVDRRLYFYVESIERSIRDASIVDNGVGRKLEETTTVSAKRSW